MATKLLSVRDLKVHFSSRRATVRAVDGVSFDIGEGETLGLLGESGCGKTTLGRAILRLQRSTSGEVFYRDRAVTGDARPFRRHMQMIFQDPYASLDPRMTVESIIAEPVRALGLAHNGGARPRVHRVMEMVGLNTRFASRYPHEFSGGQRQRIGVARALALSPKLIVCDEPVSALDVSIQAQVLNLLRTLQKDFQLTYVFITHDLSVLRQIADRIAVMYLGRLVEIGDSEQIYDAPKHPYTAALLSAVPRTGTDPRQRIVLSGDVPSPIDPPQACVFHPRCPRFHRGHCDVEAPQLRELGPHHAAACHYPLERWPMTDSELRQAEGATREDRPHLEGAAGAA